MTTIPQIQTSSRPAFCPRGYVPIREITEHLDWVTDAAACLHGDGTLLEESPDSSVYAVVLKSRFRDKYPIGDWIIVYEYSDNDGICSHRLFVAVKL